MTARPETDVRLDVEPRTAPVAARARSEQPFNLLLVGDFSGGGPREGGGAATPVFVDRDEVDDALRRMAPAIRVPLGDGGEGLEIPVRELEDFHPDRLVRRVPLFRGLREGGASGGGTRPESGRTGEPREPGPLKADDLLSGGMLDRVVEATRGEEENGDPFREWVKELGEAHGVQEPTRSDSEVEAEALVHAGLRELLHHPRFQGLEGLWRGVDELVRDVETGPRLRVFLLDLPRARARSDGPGARLGEVLRAGDPRTGDPWSVVAVSWEFGPRAADLELLAATAEICGRQGAALLADAEPAVGGAEGWDRPWAEWTALRGTAWASGVGLVTPRVLLRLPYGEDAEPCWEMDFEEIEGVPRTSDYLWGPASFVAARVLARAFARAGWGLADALEPDVGGLPLHVVRVDGQLQARPCTEHVVDQARADALLEAGITPLAWFRETDRIRLIRLQSVADPPTRLRGPWSRA